MMKRAVFALISLGSAALVVAGCSKDDGGEPSEDGGTGGFGATYTGGYGATPFGGSTGTIGGTGSGATGGSGIGNVTGSGAVTSTGGASYSVAGSCAACPGPAPIGDGTQPLIDTIDDGDTAIEKVDGREAYWFVYQDSTAGGEWTSGVTGGEPAAVEAYSGTGFIVGGIGFNTWGAGIGTNIAAPTGTGCPYDASNYAGVSFYAKGTGPVRFSVKTAATTPCSSGEQSGGLCVAECHAHMGADLTLTGEWTQYTFTWDEMTRANWGPTVEFDPKTIIGFQWQSPKAPTAFEIGIDELEFLPGSGGGTGGAGGAGTAGSAGTPATGGAASGGTAGATATAGAPTTAGAAGSGN